MGGLLSLLLDAVNEKLHHDLGPAGAPVGHSLITVSKLLRAGPWQTRGCDLLLRTHHPAFSPGVDRRIITELARLTASERRGQATGLWNLYDSFIRNAASQFLANQSSDAKRLIGSRILVVKSSTPAERGVLMVDYTYVFPLLAGLFDLQRIADRYFIVLEPSWSDCCTPEILLFTRLDAPVLVQSIEPRDTRLFDALKGNCRQVPTAPNWWVDYRTMAPPSLDQDRDIDIIMVAAWARFKRHWRFFKVLGDMRRRGHRLKVALVGYRNDKTADDIRAEARYFGVADQIEMFERISAQEVAQLYARSKVHVLWSRREGANRAIIESMLAGVPVIVREGLTYGFRYPYINPATGHFAKEDELAEAILEVIANRARYAPREWVLEHMTCHQAVAIVDEHLAKCAADVGEPWTHGMVARTSALDTQQYWQPPDRDCFRADYRFLESLLRP